MQTETYQIRGLDSHDSTYWTKNLQMVFIVREAVEKEANDIQARLSVARDMERHVTSSATKRKTKGGLSQKPKLDDATRLPGTYFIDPAGAESKETIVENAKNVGSSDASSNALQNTHK